MKRNPFKRRHTPWQKPSKLVGANLPLPVAQRLYLLSVYYERSVQSIVRELVENWVAGNPEHRRVGDRQLIEGLANRALAEWWRRIEQEIPGALNREAYLEEIRQALRQRKVSDRHIEMVIQNMIETVERAL